MKVKRAIQGQRPGINASFSETNRKRSEDTAQSLGTEGGPFRRKRYSIVKGLPRVKAVNIDLKTAVEVFAVNALCPSIAKLDSGLDSRRNRSGEFFAPTLDYASNQFVYSARLKEVPVTMDCDLAGR